MFKDISKWEHIGFAGKSTLEKEELRSPDHLKYLIKYPRSFAVGVSWEDVTELISAKIGRIYGLETMTVEIVVRDERRGCLLRNFVEEQGCDMAEEGGALLSSLTSGYSPLQESSLSKMDLIKAGFQIVEEFDYWSQIKEDFISMLFFDILIGNQDRHPYNWSLLFFSSGQVKLSPIYDNGASLGFRFDDQSLQTYLANPQKFDKYIKSTKVKAGLFEKKKVSAIDLLTYLSKYYPVEYARNLINIEGFDIPCYEDFICSLEYITRYQREWLLAIIPFRIKKIIEWARLLKE
ncbi:hypothetical protein F9B85_06685 [Heliorestis acidaminivorans]|uniref:HipA-like C-terminal domain-containing protein n=1 Tax=Heliorestis acidaminivorans TaxID=553427 RepID=A0A6I0ERF9_9FIRM|nr:HipA domain-containing protein [Heliorestis acidaminivorans]KAB2952949.1 hypothetical protein F9B85_06685 [Heliorestis acidaminivorans]